MCWCVRNPHLTIAQILAFSFQWMFWFCFLLMEWSPVPHKSPWASLFCLAVLFVELNTSITISQRLRASEPSMRNPASNEMISDSVDLRDTDVYFLHFQLMGTNVRLPNPQGLQQHLSLELNPTNSAEPCFPHDNIVGNRLCDECMRSNELNVGHKLLSTW